MITWSRPLRCVEHPDHCRSHSTRARNASCGRAGYLADTGSPPHPAINTSTTASEDWLHPITALPPHGTVHTAHHRRRVRAGHQNLATRARQHPRRPRQRHPRLQQHPRRRPRGSSVHPRSRRRRNRHQLHHPGPPLRRTVKQSATARQPVRRHSHLSCRHPRSSAAPTTTAPLRPRAGAEQRMDSPRHRNRLNHRDFSSQVQETPASRHPAEHRIDAEVR